MSRTNERTHASPSKLKNLSLCSLSGQWFFFRGWTLLLLWARTFKSLSGIVWLSSSAKSHLPALLALVIPKMQILRKVFFRIACRLRRTLLLFLMWHRLYSEEQYGGKVSFQYYFTFNVLLLTVHFARIKASRKLDLATEYCDSTCKNVWLEYTRTQIQQNIIQRFRHSNGMMMNYTTSCSHPSPLVNGKWSPTIVNRFLFSWLML